jgi:radical SAM superfamily enzyme with C-terminal helix-hairpin-helix motif
MEGENKENNLKIGREFLKQVIDENLELRNFLLEIFPYLETDQIAQHSARMDKVRAKLRAKAKKLITQPPRVSN